MSMVVMFARFLQTLMRLRLIARCLLEFLAFAVRLSEWISTNQVQLVFTRSKSRRKGKLR